MSCHSACTYPWYASSAPSDDPLRDGSCSLSHHQWRFAYTSSSHRSCPRILSVRQPVTRWWSVSTTSWWWSPCMLSTWPWPRVPGYWCWWHSLDPGNTTLLHWSWPPTCESQTQHLHSSHSHLQPQQAWQLLYDHHHLLHQQHNQHLLHHQETAENLLFPEHIFECLWSKMLIPTCLFMMTLTYWLKYPGVKPFISYIDE